MHCIGTRCTTKTRQRGPEVTLHKHSFQKARFYGATRSRRSSQRRTMQECVVSLKYMKCPDFTSAATLVDLLKIAYSAAYISH